jgi:hypothetical protein
VGHLDALQPPGAASDVLKLRHLIEGRFQRPAPMRRKQYLWIERNTFGDEKVSGLLKVLTPRIFLSPCVLLTASSS